MPDALAACNRLPSPIASLVSSRRNADVVDDAQAAGRRVADAANCYAKSPAGVHEYLMTIYCTEARSSRMQRNVPVNVILCPGQTARNRMDWTIWAVARPSGETTDHYLYQRYPLCQPNRAEVHQVGRVLHVGTFKGVVAPILHLLNGS
jgi:hypothetical protein